ncbi:hypothetical protein HJC23_008883 [Cyclotella cryptica]|uniref:Protein kinase domain-containing protein n=1 Tax=Cyclotella cryptica TaxID=29204 RepID=A0ABD3PBC2_9STRA|eukprot:CCRYP_015984-RB/>CCRYP_015984-RB protein AED:0.03 eAED:0.03 QI:94/1/1/1/0.5/0.4/5/2424/382
MGSKEGIPPPPPDWPQQADEDYERIRVLGAGAFGQVLLAKRRPQNSHSAEKYVAIKGVSILTEHEGATAEREIAILSELSHPNIIKLLDAYEPASNTAKGRYIVMSYINGPDLGELLEARGALGLPLAQLIARHLISAVAYLHARGVIHRDIKPDNIMLEGCKEGKKWISDDLMWNSSKTSSKAVEQGRFKAVLCDFGFARAILFKQHERNQSRVNLRMSAVGTKFFAAPELVENVCNKDEPDEALTQCVSNYGLIGDAYSVGATLSEIITGVPPGKDPVAYVESNRKTTQKSSSRFSKLCHILSGGYKGPYDIQLRTHEELPKPVTNLISSLMEPDPSSRLSVREAQDHEWIGGYDALEHGDVDARRGGECVPLQNIAAFK